MKKNMSEVAVEKPNMNITLDEGMIKGIEDLEIDDKVQLLLSVKITSISRDTYMKEKPLSVRAEVISGKITDGEVAEEIDSAKNLGELEKAGKKIAGGK